ncbi:hypothetical protein SCANM124S_00607 [Streptomyces canus]
MWVRYVSRGSHDVRTPHIVSAVMTHTVADIGRKSTFKEHVRLMQDRKVSALPVLGAKATSSASSPKPIRCPKRSSATATPTGTPS